ncbi:MATE family efflux transporter [Tepidibacter hydrothermalis]|uniref:Multidrug export protein MepA n=1 Tax=Tepidibacter hydrothermalis TaxID=3036126 RepID=A0ABY8E8P1_9FIRM|nr:MATE family efflux transporter [Tepidibacter hydrothermalis]WFD09275.1 MATE family efflux transporter [Tepidibacter hydrothermalis]
MDEKQKFMGSYPINKLLLKFSIPAIIGMLVMALYNIADGIFIGKGVGALALGGVTIAMPIMLVMMAIALMVGVGAASAISRKIGEGNIESAEKVLGEAVSLNLIVNFLFTIILFAFMDQILIICGATPSILPYAKEYMNVIAFGILINSFAMSTNHPIRAEGNAKVAMITMVIGAIVNIVLDYIFIFIFRMGVTGAALATIIAQSCSAIWILMYYLKGNSILKIRKSNMKFTIENVREIVTVGMATFFRQISGSLLMIIVNKTLVAYGNDYYVVALGIINRVMMFMFMPMYGIVQGFQPIAGFNYGAKKIKRVQESLKYANVYATILSVIGFLIALIFPTQVMKIFTNDQTTIDIGVEALSMMIWGLPVVGIQTIGASLFQAIGKGTESVILTMSRQILLLIPLVIILPNFMGVHGVFYSYPISDIGSFLITLVLVAKENIALKNYRIQEEF